MATKTRADLVVKVLEKLQIVPEGQTPEVEDTARVDRNLPPVLRELAAREIIYVPDIENIPEEWFLSLASVAAYELRSEFGVTGEFEVTLKNASDEGIGKLYVMRRGRPTYEPLKTLSF